MLHSCKKHIWDLLEHLKYRCRRWPTVLLRCYHPLWERQWKTLLPRPKQKSLILKITHCIWIEVLPVRAEAAIHNGTIKTLEQKKKMVQKCWLIPHLFSHQHFWNGHQEHKPLGSVVLPQSSPQLGHQTAALDLLSLSETGLLECGAKCEISVWRVNGICEGKVIWDVEVVVKTVVLESCRYTAAGDP